MDQLRSETAAASQVLLLRHQQVEPDVHHFTRVIVGVVWTVALKLTSLMSELVVELDVVACNAVLRACGRDQAWSTALNLLQGESLRPDAISFNTAMVAVAWPAALRSAMTSMGCQPDTVTQNTEASSWVRRGQWQQALLQLFNQAAGPDSYSFTIATTAFEEAQSWSQALSLYTLAQLYRSRQHLLPSVNAVMSACTSQACWAFALEILQHLQRSTCRGDAITMGQCARSFQLAVLWQNALELLEGQVFDEQIANLVIQSCAVAGQFSAVVCLLKYGDARGLSMAVASARWTSALSLLLRASGSRMAHSTVAINAAISACKEHSWKFGGQLLQTISRFMLRLDIFSFHAAADIKMANTWRFSLAHLVMMTQMLVRQDLVTHGVKMSVLAESQLWQEGQLLLGLLNSQQILPDVFICNSVISASAPCGWMKALESTTILANAAVLPDGIIFCTVMDACASYSGARDWIHGLQVYSTMLEEKLRVDERSCSAALQCCGRGMAWPVAQKILLQMLVASLTPNEIGVDTLIRCYKKAIHPWPLALVLLKCVQNFSFPTRECKSGAVAACEAASVPCVLEDLT